MERLKEHLPSRERATGLIECYFEHAGWFYCPLNREDFINKVFSAVYPTAGTERCHGPHDLAVLFMVFAVGALVDLTAPPFNDESEVYMTLAKAAACIETPWNAEGSSIELVQFLNLLIYYW